MKRLIICCLFLSIHNAFAQSDETCSGWPSWSKPACQRLHQVWTEGDNELYLTGYAWHNRYTYSREKINTYNEQAWGGGLGKGFVDEKGNWHGLYAFAFLDSHRNVEPIAGYAYMKMAHLSENIRFGGGLSVFLTARPDIFNNIPFPGVLPWISLNYRKASISATYIPGSSGAGNVLFIVTKWTLPI